MLYFTYSICSDGLGSQYQRIIGIISLAEKYGGEYVHSKIKEMDHLSNMEYLEKIEDYFQISNNFKSVNEIAYDEIVFQDRDFSNETIEIYKQKSKDKNILFSITQGFCMFDQHYKTFDIPDPSIYNYGLSKIKTFTRNIPLPEYINNKNINIAIHIRRGDVTSTKNIDRYISLEFYQEIINRIKCRYQNGNIFIFTEITPEYSDEFVLFQSKNPDVKILADIDIITTLEYMIKADILIMSKSSFSFVAGLYNTNTVYYIDFHHSKLDRWHNLQELTTTFISGSGFHEISKWSFCPRYPQRLEPQNFERDDIVFLNLDKFIDFIRILYNNHPRNKFILITHNSDQPFTDRHYEMIQNSVSKVYAINCTCTNPNVKTIPIGFRYEPLIPFRGQQMKTTDIIQKIPNIINEKPILLYMNFVIATNKEKRTECFNNFAKEQWVTKEEIVSLEDFYMSILKSKYTLSPQGNGIDCHRIYESIYFNSIPILKTTPMDNYYRRLPVIIVEDWSEVTEAFLTENYENYYSNLLKWKKDNDWLNPKFWMQ